MILVFWLILLVSCPSFGAAIEAEPSSGTREFHSIIERRLEAMGAGDVAAYMALLDKDYVAISDVGTRRTRGEIPDFVADTSKLPHKYRVRTVNARIFGDIAVVDAEIAEGMVDAQGGWRETDIFVRKNGQWLFLHRQDTAVLQPLSPVPLGGEKLDDYEGVYQTARGSTDYLTVKDGQLLGRSNLEEEPMPFVHVGPGAFALAGVAGVIIFSRDSSGRVTGFVAYSPGGQIVPSQKVDP